MSRSIAVRVSDLEVRFGEFFAVNKISFEVFKGEIFGFLGANGAGKTTTIRVLCGLLEPSSGSVWVTGQDLKEGVDPIKARVGYMSQKFTLYSDLTVAENLRFMGSLRNLSLGDFQRRRKELLEMIGFKQSDQTLVSDLPGGVKQQVSLAAALLHDPEIIFLDEPTAGVSPTSRSLFWSLIRSIAARGKTIFVTTHYMDEAEQCDRIALMRDGKIVAADTPARLKSQFFPEGVFEFEPVSVPEPKTLGELKRENWFAFFEPYGLRFHAVFKDREAQALCNEKYGREFKIRSIQPSLEDVFIRSVEG